MDTNMYLKLKEQDMLRLVNQKTKEKYEFIIARIGEDEKNNGIVEIFPIINEKSIAVKVIKNSEYLDH